MAAAKERKVPMLRSENSLIEQEFESVREKFENDMHKMEDEMAKFRSQLLVSEKNLKLFSAPINTTAISSTSASTSSSECSSFRTELDQHHQKQQQQQQSNRSSSSSSSNEQTRSRSSRASLVKSSIKSAFEEKDELVERHKQQLEAISSMNETAISQRQHYSRVGPTTKPNAAANFWWLNELGSPLIKDSGDGGGGKMLKLRFDVTQYEPEQIIVKTMDNRLLVHAKREQTTENSSVYSEYNREFLLPEGIDPELIRSSLSADGVLTVEAPLLPIEIGQEQQQQ